MSFLSREAFDDARPHGATSMRASPWRRSGIVVHDPSTPIDGLLAEFALLVRARGFNVAGFIQANNRGCSGSGDGCAPRVDYFDLAISKIFSAERGAFPPPAANTGNADLLVVSRFSSVVDTIEAVGDAGASDERDGPCLLTSIAGGCINKWYSRGLSNGTMLGPYLASLWAWWGPGHIYRDLALGVDDSEVRRIVCSSRWILVEGPSGTGLGFLPRPPRELFSRLPMLQRMSLRDLARLAQSWNPAEAALGLAAINAHYNRRDIDVAPGNGVRGLHAKTGRIAVVGAFPGVKDIFPDAAIIDSAPRAGEYPSSALEGLLGGCEAVIVNSSSLVTQSLPNILRLSHGRRLALIGPTTPLTRRLREYGVASTGGLIITDSDGLARAIRAGAQSREFGRFGRWGHL